MQFMVLEKTYQKLAIDGHCVKAYLSRGFGSSHVFLQTPHFSPCKISPLPNIDVPKKDKNQMNLIPFEIPQLPEASHEIPHFIKKKYHRKKFGHNANFNYYKT